jgi:hypothetical protein
MKYLLLAARAALLGAACAATASAAATLASAAPATPASIAQEQSGNTTTKSRATPSEQAARVGQWISWRSDLEAALAEAERTGKPIFWSIPTIQGSFMDRKTEVERYWLGGPMSWPRTIELLERDYIPVHLPADKQLCEKYGIEPIAFIEPGYLVLGSDGEEAFREQRLTTFHPDALLEPLERHVESDTAPKVRAALIGRVDRGFVARNVRYDWLEANRVAPQDLSLQAIPAELHAETLFWIGVRCYQDGPKQHARAIWERLAAEHPEHPLAAKVALELEGLGPFLHGLESFNGVPEAALDGEAEGSAAPDGVYSPADLWTRSIRFLGQLQAPNGSFLDTTYDFGGADSLPNVVTAISSLAYQAGLEGLERGYQARLDFSALKRHLESDAAFALDDTDEIAWARAYRLRAYLRALELDPERREALAPVIRADIAALEGLQRDDGFWYHEYANAMVSATVLLALDQARRNGFEVDEVSAKRGAAAVALCRVEPGNYTYYPPRGKARAAIGGSPGRGPLCELALVRWELASMDDLRVALVASFENEAPWVRVRKYDNHARPHAIGGFFFWWGMRGRAEAIAALPEGSQRDAFSRDHWELTCSLAEVDGTFVDSHELGRAYGTSMALLTLACLGEVLPEAEESEAEAPR